MTREEREAWARLQRLAGKPPIPSPVTVSRAPAIAQPTHAQAPVDPTPIDPAPIKRPRRPWAKLGPRAPIKPLTPKQIERDRADRERFARDMERRRAKLDKRNERRAARMAAMIRMRVDNG